jgi:mRNA interferase MazF
VKRGEIWTVASGGPYAKKPRPALLVQDDAFAETGSVVVCLITTEELDAPTIRLPVAPRGETGLRRRSHVMIDKVMAVPREQVGKRLGRLPGDEMIRVDSMLPYFLGLDR